MKKIFKKKNLNCFIFIICLIFFLLLPQIYTSISKTFIHPLKEIPYSLFLNDVTSKKVKAVSINEKSLEVTYNSGEKVNSQNPKNPDFIKLLVEKDIKVEEVKHVDYISSVISFVFIGCLVMLIGYCFQKKMGGMNKIVPDMNFTTDERTLTTFKDIAGIDEAKEEVMEIVDYLANPEKFIKMGIKPRTGIMLYGDPGTGKTLLARAIAGEAKVPFFSVSGSDFAEKYVGVGASRVRELMKKARENAPCIVYIDEIDCLASNRDNENSEKNQTVNAFLNETGGFKDNSGIILMASTNRLESIDKAIVRSGRFGKKVHVTFPNVEGREQILKIHSKKTPLNPYVDLKEIAELTTGFSGADLEDLVNESAIMALRDNCSEVSPDHFLKAFDTVIAGNKKKKPRITKEEKLLTAYHESGHAIVAKFLAEKEVMKISIAPTDKALGYIYTKPNESNMTKKQLFNSICECMGGHVAESLIYGEDSVTVGSTQDLAQATQIARNMVFSYGFSPLGNICIDGLSKNNHFDLSENIKNKAFGEIQNILNEATAQTKDFLEKNMDKLEILCKEVMIKENLNKKQIDKLFE